MFWVTLEKAACLKALMVWIVFTVLSIGKNWKVLGPFSVGIEDQLKNTFDNCYLVEWGKKVRIAICFQIPSILNNSNSRVSFEIENWLCSSAEKVPIVRIRAKTGWDFPMLITSSNFWYFWKCPFVVLLCRGWEVCSSNENFCFLAFAVIIVP